MNMTTDDFIDKIVSWRDGKILPMMADYCEIYNTDFYNSQATMRSNYYLINMIA